MGQSVIVENRPGANGRVTAETASRAKPDGSKLWDFTNNNDINGASFHKLPYDIREFALVTMVSEVPHRVTMHPSLPAKTVKGLIMMAKDNAWGGYSSQPIVAPR